MALNSNNLTMLSILLLSVVCSAVLVWTHPQRYKGNFLHYPQTDQWKLVGLDYSGFTEKNRNLNKLVKMLMPKANRRKIYEQLFNEGVMVAKKDFHAPNHPELEGIPNLHVIKALQSLKSRGYVSEQFAWRHYYWYLKNEGIEYLRDYLHLPAEIVPATLHRQQRTETARPRPAAPRGEGKVSEDRSAYRRTGGEGDKKTEAGAGGAQVEFRGGFGRGRGAPPPSE